MVHTWSSKKNSLPGRLVLGQKELCRPSRAKRPSFGQFAAWIYPNLLHGKSKLRFEAQLQANPCLLIQSKWLTNFYTCTSAGSCRCLIASITFQILFSQASQGQLATFDLPTSEPQLDDSLFFNILHIQASPTRTSRQNHQPWADACACACLCALEEFWRLKKINSKELSSSRCFGLTTSLTLRRNCLPVGPASLRGDIVGCWEPTYGRFRFFDCHYIHTLAASFSGIVCKLLAIIVSKRF